MINFNSCLLKDLEEHMHVVKSINGELLSKVELAVEIMISTLQKDGSVYVLGNGGSAGDSQHFVAEMVGRFLMERAPLRFFALTTNSSIITAIGNDYSYYDVFARQVQAAVRTNDTLVAISTSGNSANVIKAIEVAKERGCSVIGLTGQNGGKMKDLCDLLIHAPSNSTPRIQEIHILFIHMMCNLLEKRLFT